MAVSAPPSAMAYARPATGAMAGPDFTAWIGARAMSPASITPPCDVTTIMAPANPAARNRALLPSRYSPISGLSEASKIFPNYTDKFWPYKTDLDKARALLKEAGFQSSFDKIGLKTKLEGLPSAVYSETKFTKKQMAHCDNFQWPWIADTGYTAWVYLTHPKTNVMDAVNNDDPELNELTEKAFQVPYGPERTKNDLRIQQIAGERVPWLFMVNSGWREAFKKEWVGFHWYQ